MCLVLFCFFDRVVGEDDTVSISAEQRPRETAGIYREPGTLCHSGSGKIFRQIKIKTFQKPIDKDTVMCYNIFVPQGTSNLGEFPSGQRGQTVNLLAPPSVVRIHLPPFKRTRIRCVWFFFVFPVDMEKLYTNHSFFICAMHTAQKFLSTTVFCRINLDEPPGSLYNKYKPTNHRRYHYARS